MNCSMCNENIDIKCSKCKEKKKRNNNNKRLTNQMIIDMVNKKLNTHINLDELRKDIPKDEII